MTATSEQQGRADRRLGVIVPAGMAVLTWVVVLLLVGVGLEAGTAPLSLLGHLLVAVSLLLPLIAFAPWRDGVTARVRAWVTRRRRRLELTAALFALTLVVVTVDAPQLLIALAELPASLATTSLYRVTAVYDAVGGVTVARALFWFGQWYLTAVWLYVLVSVVTAVRPTTR